MQVIVVFMLFALGLDAVAVGVCTIIERYSEHASLFAFLAFFVVNFILAWQLAVYVVERYLITDGQRQRNEDHKKWVNSLFVPARR